MIKKIRPKTLRGLTEKVVTGFPLGVNRISGSLPQFPIISILFNDDIIFPLF